MHVKKRHDRTIDFPITWQILTTLVLALLSPTLLAPSTAFALRCPFLLDTGRLEQLPSLLFSLLALGLVQLGHLFLVNLALLLLLLVPLVDLVLAQSLDLLQERDRTLLLGIHDDRTLLQVGRVSLRSGHL